MVIIEVKRDFDGFDRLLGEHKWNEFLRNPSKEEREKVTRVYYCVYNSGRQVQKNGAFVVASWFSQPIHHLVKVGRGLMPRKVGSETGAQGTSEYMCLRLPFIHVLTLI
jgi:hypothetical protein